MNKYDGGYYETKIFGSSVVKATNLLEQAGGGENGLSQEATHLRRLESRDF